MPLNIRCSNRWAKPVLPFGSSFEPTLYHMLTADDRRLVVLVDDHGQAVVEHELLVRDGDFLDQRGDRGRLGAGRRGSDGGRRRRDRLDVAGAVAQAASSEALASSMDRRRSM